MTKKFLWMTLILSLALVFSAVAYAQEDDDAADDDVVADDDAADDDFDASTVAFTNPVGLDANTTYTFEFEVFNAAEAVTKGEKGIWINKVEMVLPSEDYVLAGDEEQPEAPDCLNAGDYCDDWEAIFDSTNNMITWQSFGMVTTVEYGDIREQDVQTFSFIATTDADPTDGFAWTLWGDNGAFVQGIWNFPGPEPDDDDITPDDDDGGDDDDDSGGCGC